MRGSLHVVMLPPGSSTKIILPFVFLQISKLSCVKALRPLSRASAIGYRQAKMAASIGVPVPSLAALLALSTMSLLLAGSHALCKHTITVASAPG